MRCDRRRLSEEQSAGGPSRRAGQHNILSLTSFRAPCGFRAWPSLHARPSPRQARWASRSRAWKSSLMPFHGVTPRFTATPTALPIALSLSRRGQRSTGLVLYQMAAYLSRFAPTNIPRSWGVLIYPQLATPVSIPLAEQFTPWSFGDGKKDCFHHLAPSIQRRGGQAALSHHI